MTFAEGQIITMKNRIIKILSLLTCAITVMSCAACGAKVEYESYYEDVPNGNSGGNSSAVSSEEPASVDGDSSSAISSTSSSTNNSNLSVDAFLESMPSKLRGSTIKMFFWDDLRSTVYKTALENFQKETGIKVEIEIADKQTYNTTLAARISSGKSPDVVKCIDNNAGTVSNLQPITSSGYDFSDSKWDKNLMKIFTYNGKCYATNVQDSPNKNMGLFVYNKKALKRANMSGDDPYTIWKKNPSAWTWSKFWDMCDKFVKANGNKEGYYGSTWGTEDGYVKAFGVTLWRYDTDAGKFINCSNTDESVKRYGELINAISKKWSTSVIDVTSFNSGKILFSWTYSSSAEKASTAYESLRNGNNLGFVPMPIDSAYTPLFETCAYGIPVGAKNAAAVPYFLRAIFSPESVDEKSFYYNDEAKTVVESVIKENKFFYGNGYNYDIWQEMIKGTGTNVKSILDAYQGVINDTVSLENSKLSKLN